MDVKKMGKLFLVLPPLEKVVRSLFFGLVLLLPVILVADAFIFWKYYRTVEKKEGAAIILQATVSRSDLSRALDIIKDREFFDLR
ncbi:MAG: hypothetical protein HYW90_00815 [Candidatus Sungbacteria bacterium]|nr:hypothetical protein [Candidatus Sungbacteria bacterium]